MQAEPGVYIEAACMAFVTLAAGHMLTMPSARRAVLEQAVLPHGFNLGPGASALKKQTGDTRIDLLPRAVYLASRRHMQARPV